MLLGRVIRIPGTTYITRARRITQLGGIDVLLEYWRLIPSKAENQHFPYRQYVPLVICFVGVFIALRMDLEWSWSYFVENQAVQHTR